MLAHYAARGLIHEATDKAGKDPDELSFVHAVCVMHRRILNPDAFPTENQPAGGMDETLGEHVVSSHGPVKPRNAKRKMGSFPCTGAAQCRTGNTAGYPKSSRIFTKATVLRYKASSYHHEGMISPVHRLESPNSHLRKMIS